MLRTIVAAALLVALYGTAHGANVDYVNSVMICTSNIYADGFIYRSSSSGVGSFPAKKSFPLYMAVSSHSGTPLDPVMPAQLMNTHVYEALDEQLYINASTGAYAPVGFVSGSNSTLGRGETTWGFYSPYGILMWYNPLSTVHIQGFEWVPVEGYADLKQLYWNQTQYDLAAALGSKSGMDASKAAFGHCAGDANPTVSFAL